MQTPPSSQLSPSSVIVIISFCCCPLLSFLGVREAPGPVPGRVGDYPRLGPLALAGDISSSLGRVLLPCRLITRLQPAVPTSPFGH